MIDVMNPQRINSGLYKVYGVLYNNTTIHSMPLIIVYFLKESKSSDSFLYSSHVRID
jgi:hypothetical protein